MRRSLGQTQQGYMVSLENYWGTLGYDASIVWESRRKLETTRDNMLAPKRPQRGLREAEGWGSMYFARVNFRRYVCPWRASHGLREHLTRVFPAVLHQVELDEMSLTD